ncbi:polysaccharide biosynthesis/export family protein [Roseicyclus elongatus]|uniref:polysaccharide biosynthesis/export family protein n=1 Tax=Roseicyclus elongatus TaxID=159346 RepID=UPI0004B56274
MTDFILRLALGWAALTLAACAQVSNPSNIEPVDSGGGYQAQYRDPDPVTRNAPPRLISPDLNAQQCHPPRGGAARQGPSHAALVLTAERLTRGDLLDVRVADDETFSGSYEISRDGTLRLPFLDPIPAHGRRTETVEAELATALVAGGFYVGQPRVSVRVMDAAGVSVSVSGAVFEPRPVDIGGVAGDEVDSLRQAALGASAEGRDLAAALRSAGGIRPDADLSAVEIRRRGVVHVIDLRPVLDGLDRADVPLLTGDEVFVPSRGCFQDALMRPSPISPPGVTLFLSNLTQPAAGTRCRPSGERCARCPMAPGSCRRSSIPIAWGAPARPAPGGRRRCCPAIRSAVSRP